MEKLDFNAMSIPDFAVGLESRMKDLIEVLKSQSKGVCIIGIWGMGGVGKTTIAKALYNKIRRDFEDKSFLANIREVWEKDMGQIDLQKQLLSDILKIRKMNMRSVEWVKGMIKERLCRKRALIVLDDVTTLEQVNALCGNREWIGQGSVIIVTTRDVRILNILEVDDIYRMKEMDEKESLELFSWHAFRETSPQEDFFELSRSVVTLCGGLPLALEVLGSYLYKREKEQWRSVLSKLKRIPNNRVQQKLRISFDGLEDPMLKDIFLDICCFFIGKDRAYVTEILNGCGLHADIGIAVLIEQSLVTIVKNNKLGTHDLLRDMGREIVRERSPENLEERSRLWLHEDALEVLTANTGTKAVEGFTLRLHEASEACFSTKAFMKMNRLRLLQLYHVQLSGDYKHLPKHLRWLYWQGFPLTYIPNNFYQGNLVAIALKHSNLKLVWKEPQLMERLKILNLSHSKSLTKTPDFSKLPNLEKLILKDCPSLSEVHQSIGDLRNLLLINLKGCTSLRNLPMTIYKLKSVKTLIISGCSMIDKFEEDIIQMESLTTLLADLTGIKLIPFSILRSKSIGYISLCGHEGLAHDVFPSFIWSWMSPANLKFCIPQFWSMSTSLVSMDVQQNLGGVLTMLTGLSKLRSVSVQCNSDSQLTSELRRIVHGLSDVSFTELETTSYAAQISENSIGYLLIGMGSFKEVINTLSKTISEGSNGSSDLVLPGDNVPYWLAYEGEGHSTLFEVPCEDRDWCMKGMTLCVVYSSTPQKMEAEYPFILLIINHTKLTMQIYKRDTKAYLFNDEEWQGIISNLGAGDKVQIFFAFGHGVTIDRTAVYLINDQPITLETEASAYAKIEQSTNAKIEQSTELSAEVKTTNPSVKPNKNIFRKLTKKMRECMCVNRNEGLSCFLCFPIPAAATSESSPLLGHQE
ncbi:unnamed protein product [Lupinus luteus]|uniref:TMV resistance protein N n=1 Tax=Lupinus luteus TaxID=3873 RepID=A0AAV1Y6D0_LUPLU